MNLQPQRRATCRLCGSRSLVEALSLAPTPPANAFVNAEAQDQAQDRFPLDLYLCDACGHLQLLDVLSPFVLFQRGRSPIATLPTQVERANAFAARILAAHRPAAESFVLCIGSNDGTLLKTFEDAEYRVHGVEPAVDLARAAIEAGVPTFPGFFGPGVATRLEEEHGHAEIIIAPSVLGHVDDLHGFMEAVCLLLSRGGLMVFEVPCLMSLVDGVLIDAVRHENLSYHAVAPLISFLHSCDLELVAIEVEDRRLRGFVQHLGGPRPIEDSVGAVLDREAVLGLANVETYRRVGDEIAGHARDLGALLTDIRADGRSIAALGAPARATTVMHAFGLDADMIDFVVDDSPWKQGLYVPGLGIPVLPQDAIAQRRPDVLVVLAWDDADAVIARHSAFHDSGGRFIVPLPVPKVV